jgi:hypothetical protein
MAWPGLGLLCVQVFVAAVSKRKQVCPSTASTQAVAGSTVHEMSVNTTDICHINKFRYQIYVYLLHTLQDRCVS